MLDTCRVYSFLLPLISARIVGLCTWSRKYWSRDFKIFFILICMKTQIHVEMFFDREYMLKNAIAL